MATVIDRTRRGSLLFIGRFPSTSQSQRSVRVLRLRRGSSAKKKTSRTKDAEEKRRAPHLLDEVGFEKTSFEWKSTPTIERRPIRKVLARLTVETLVITASVLYVRRQRYSTKIETRVVTTSVFNVRRKRYSAHLTSFISEWKMSIQLFIQSPTTHQCWWPIGMISTSPTAETRVVTIGVPYVRRKRYSRRITSEIS